MGCNNCQDKWRIVLAQQLKMENMKKNHYSSDESEQNSEVDNNSLEEIKQAVFIPEPVVVKPFARPDVNKIISERREAIESGKIIKK